MKEFIENLVDRYEKAEEELKRLQYESVVDSYGYLKQRRGLELAKEIAYELLQEYHLKNSEKSRDRQKIAENGDSYRNAWLPCCIGDTIYRVDTDVELGRPLQIEYDTVESIVIASNNDVLFKYDNYDGIICHLEHLDTDNLYLGWYRCFTDEEAAKNFILEQGGTIDER